MSTKNAKKKNLKVKISPNSLRGSSLPRVVDVVYEGGNFKRYYLIHIPAKTVIAFWKMEDIDKLRFLYINCDGHHRLPKIQKGKRGKNISRVDKVSHRKYNDLISLVSRSSSLSVEKVKPVHIQRFVEHLFPVVERLFIDPDSGMLFRLEVIEQIFNEVWLPADDPISLKTIDLI